MIYKTNLADVRLANLARTMIWYPVFDFRFEHIDRFRGLSGTIFHNFTPRFIMDSVPKKTVRELLLSRWTPLLSS